MSYTVVRRERQPLQAGHGRRLPEYNCTTAETNLQAGRGRRLLYCRSDDPASWPREATSRTQLYNGSDNPCKLAAGGDFSYTFVLRERRRILQPSWSGFSGQSEDSPVTVAGHSGLRLRLHSPTPLPRPSEAALQSRLRPETTPSSILGGWGNQRSERGRRGKREAGPRRPRGGPGCAL